MTVGSTNDANARTLLNTQLPIQKNLSNVVVPVPGIDPFDATFMIDARTDHLGAGEIIVASGTYAKAYSTNTNVFVDVTNAEDLELPLIGTLEAGTAMISDSITVHYGIDINDGVLKQESASKVVYLAPSVLGTTIPQNVNGYEMELQSVVKATTE